MADVLTLPTVDKRIGFFTPLLGECHALKLLGLSPISVVMYARTLQFEPLLEHCFPAMPEHVRKALLDGSSQLILDHYNQWQIIEADSCGHT